MYTHVVYIIATSPFLCDGYTLFCYDCDIL